MKAALGKNADAVKAFTRWFDESNKHWIGSREERGTFQANGLIQLGDVHRSLGQVRQSVLPLFNGRGGGRDKVINFGALMNSFGGVAVMFLSHGDLGVRL